MIRFAELARVAILEGMIAGMVLGVVHALILAGGGLYVLAGPAEVAASLARYAALMGFAGVLAGLVVVVALSGQTRFRPLLLQRAVRPGPVLLLVLYAAPWVAFLTKVNLGRGAVPVVGVVAAVLLALLFVLTLRWLARRSPPAERLPFAPRRTVAIGLVVLWAVCYGAMWFVGAPDVHPGSVDTEASPLEELRNAASSRFSRRASVFPGDRWNILLLTVDTLRADRLACYGYPRDTSPHIDALAKSGMLFTHALCQRPKTSPSFATILTGTYPARHGIHGAMSPLAARNTTLAEYLRDGGWTTAAVVTNGNLYPAYGFDQGFDTYQFGHKRANTGTDLTIAWLEAHALKAEPWFLWVHFTDPHTPYSPPPPYNTMFGGADAGQRTASDLYDGEIRYTDNHIGRILDWLEANYLRSRTLIVFTADHGESLGEHDYYYSHGLHAYEPSVRIPLIVSAPGVVPRASRSGSLVGGVDILPTILDALWIDVPDVVQGRSFLPSVLGLSDESPQDFVFVEAGYHNHDISGRTQALRRKSTKYVQRLTSWARRPVGLVSVVWTMDARLEGGLAADEFYDLEADPAETRNLLSERRSLAMQERRVLQSFAARLATEGGRETLHTPAVLDSATYKSLKSLGYID